MGGDVRRLRTAGNTVDATGLQPIIPVGAQTADHATVEVCTMNKAMRESNPMVAILPPGYT